MKRPAAVLIDCACPRCTLRAALDKAGLELRATRRDLALASGTLAACLAVLVDPDTGEWRELQSCADAVQDLSTILDTYRAALAVPFS